VHHLPTALTLLRVLIAPVIAYAVLLDELMAAFALGWLAGLTDFLDGFLARRFGWESRFGAALDAISDKLLLCTAYAALAVTFHIPLWFVILVFGRDIFLLVVGALGLLFTNIREFPPSHLGKLSTALQLLTAGAVMYGFRPIIPPMIYASAAITGLSGVHYFFRALSKLHVVLTKDGLNPIDGMPRGM
jgi:cardiolipin synthase